MAEKSGTVVIPAYFELTQVQGLAHLRLFALAANRCAMATGWSGTAGDLEPMPSISSLRTPLAFSAPPPGTSNTLTGIPLRSTSAGAERWSALRWILTDLDLSDLYQQFSPFGLNVLYVYALCAIPCNNAGTHEIPPDHGIGQCP